MQPKINFFKSSSKHLGQWVAVNCQVEFSKDSHTFLSSGLFGGAPLSPYHLSVPLSIVWVEEVPPVPLACVEQGEPGLRWAPLHRRSWGRGKAKAKG